MSLIDPPKHTITHVPLFDSWSPGTWHENKCQGTLGPFQLALVCQQGKSKGQKTTFWNRTIINRVLYCLSSNGWQHNTQKVAKTKKSADSCKCCILSGYQDVDSWKYQNVYWLSLIGWILTSDCYIAANTQSLCPSITTTRKYSAWLRSDLWSWWSRHKKERHSFKGYVKYTMKQYRSLTETSNSSHSAPKTKKYTPSQRIGTLTVQFGDIC